MLFMAIVLVAMTISTIVVFIIIFIGSLKKHKIINENKININTNGTIYEIDLHIKTMNLEVIKHIHDIMEIQDFTDKSNSNELKHDSK